MPVFKRRRPFPIGKYGDFREYIREDFRGCCCYCLLHEIIATGVQNFELEHRKPQSKFKPLINKYSNIFWSCHPCNQTKSIHWPKKALEDQGITFVDMTKENFSTHFVEEKDGFWRPISDAGEYTAAKVDLNNEHLMELRCLLRGAADRKSLPYIDWNKISKSDFMNLVF